MTGRIRKRPIGSQAAKIHLQELGHRSLCGIRLPTESLSEDIDDVDCGNCLRYEQMRMRRCISKGKEA